MGISIIIVVFFVFWQNVSIVGFLWLCNQLILASSTASRFAHFEAISLNWRQTNACLVDCDQIMQD